MRLLLFLFVAFPAFAAEKPLNILLITADDMNADSPGWMGNPLKPTPNIDAFASGSHRFRNHHVSAPICQPSRSAIMTGRFPHHSGGLGFDPINNGVPTLVTILREKGYFTAGLNKLPHMKPDSAFPWDAKYDGSAKNPGRLGTQLAEAIRTASAADKPFFINCNIGDPHRPFFGAPPKGRKAADAATDEDEDAGPNEAKTGLAHVLTATEATVPKFLEDLPRIREEVAQYTNSVQRLDLSFGKVMAALNESGQADRTIVLFLSDHGMSMPFSKATVYFNGTWSPVLLRVPGKNGDQDHPELLSSIDILPTLLELTGVPLPPEIDGVSWLPLLEGAAQSGRDRVFTHVNGVSSGKQFPQRAVNTRTRSLIFAPWSRPGENFKVEAMQGLTYPALAGAAGQDAAIHSRLEQYISGFPLALYDLEKDPAQRTNVIDDPAYAADRAELEKSLLSHLEKSRDPQLEAFQKQLAKKP